tara:strand:+ start:412 stop:678 length:267 start_codon:yes stop_codon:yes gene_type:complete
MRISKELIKEMIKDAIEKHPGVNEDLHKGHPWNEGKEDDDNVRDLLNQLYKAYKSKRDYNKAILQQIEDIKKAIARSRKETNFKSKAK